MEPIILFNIGWMRRYRGLSPTDRIVGGGRYVVEHHTGGEIKNFLPNRGRLQGYARLPRGGALNMRRLGAATDADYQDGVTVIFSATRPEPGAGRVIIGWYRNARVWREPQPRHPFPYIAEAKRRDCTLLDEDERVFPVPHRPGGQFHAGRTVGYLDRPDAREFVRQVRRHIGSRNRIPAHKRSRIPPPRAGPRRSNRRNRIPAHKRSRIPVDALLRKKVETVAVQCVVDYYETKGYNCVSVEKDNVGWDFECTQNEVKYLVEVKGCSGGPDVPRTSTLPCCETVANTGLRSSPTHSSTLTLTLSAISRATTHGEPMTTDWPQSMSRSRPGCISQIKHDLATTSVPSQGHRPCWLSLRSWGRL